ncbi:venom allergen 5-like [Schistocerca piceifrons]|uniref:venom allergen 5-like n=1 Tax=Schistocerca piceifrons TaxID=274613 RepID=UPI001F5EC3F8|nr:venom allergen 5-like [Schistocerca piceifrons]
MGSTIRLNAVTLAIVVIATLLTKTTGQSSYCSLCSDHTLCIYQGIGSACSQVMARGVDDAAQQTILKEHNTHRNYVASGRETQGAPGPQPAASNMLKLVWDTELATVAQQWADQCTSGHDTCRRVSRFSAVGQNAYQSWTTGPLQGAQWNNTVQSWYNEVNDFNKNNVNNYTFGTSYGHYSQVVWGNTHNVGCGYTAIRRSDRNYQYYVCNYGPSGNYGGQQVYSNGTSCSACTSGCDTTYNSLCA